MKFSAKTCYSIRKLELKKWNIVLMQKILNRLKNFNAMSERILTFLKSTYKLDVTKEAKILTNVKQFRAIRIILIELRLISSEIGKFFVKVVNILRKTFI